MILNIDIMGRSYHTAEKLPEQLELPDGASLEDAIRSIRGQLPAGQSLPESCLVIVSGRHLGTVGQHDPCALRDGDELVLVAPVAGG